MRIWDQKDRRVGRRGMPQFLSRPYGVGMGGWRYVSLAVPLQNLLHSFKNLTCQVENKHLSDIRKSNENC